MTMQVIQHIELGSAQAAITFNSIAGTFTDLQVVLSLRSTVNASGTYDFAYMKINNLTTSFSNPRLLQGDGSTAASYNPSGAEAYQIALIPGSSATSSTFGSISLYIPNYASSNSKSYSIDVVHETNATTAYQQLWAGLWSSSSAITSLEFYSKNGNLAAGSSATLYGITKGSDGIVTVS